MNDYRNEFINLDEKIFLAACSHSPLSKNVLFSLERYKYDLLEYGNPWDLWVEKVNIAKSLFANLINANVSEICPHFSVSSALTALLSSIDYEKRNEIVVSDMEYPTTNFIFLAQQKYGARVKTIENENYKIPINKYLSKINKNTILVSAIHVSSLNGFRQDIHQIGEIAHSAGAYLYVDAYQSLGTINVDVKKENIDFLTSGTLKWLLGLPGLAFLYVKNDLIDDLKPTNIGWFSQKNPFLFGARKLEYAEGADRFQSGTWSIPSVYAAIEGMKIILKVGVENIERKIGELTKYALEVANDLGLESITPKNANERGAIVSFLVKSPHKVETILRKENIITSARDRGIRIAPHFYNTKEEIEKAVTRISELKEYE
jgi:selenocysteine lyase/cysteine desulfurase